MKEQAIKRVGIIMQLMDGLRKDWDVRYPMDE